MAAGKEGRLQGTRVWQLWVQRQGLAKKDGEKREKWPRPDSIRRQKDWRKIGKGLWCGVDILVDQTQMHCRLTVYVMTAARLVRVKLVGRNRNGKAVQIGLRWDKAKSLRRPEERMGGDGGFCCVLGKRGQRSNRSGRHMKETRGWGSGPKVGWL